MSVVLQDRVEERVENFDSETGYKKAGADGLFSRSNCIS